MRVALGAGRARLVRQLLTESLLLSAAGGLVGVLLAAWGLGAAIAGLPRELPRMYEITLNVRVLGVTALISVLGGLMFGIVPALQISRMNHQDALKSSGRGATATRGARRLRSALVAGEVAVVLVHGERRELLFESLVNPGRPIPSVVTSITGIRDDMVRAAPRFEEVAERVMDALTGRVFVAHNARFDWGFLGAELRRVRNLRLEGPRLCTVRLARRVVKSASRMRTVTVRARKPSPRRSRPARTTRCSSSVRSVSSSLMSRANVSSRLIDFCPL